MKTNLHIHSRYSDGTQWHKEIVHRAKKIGLELIALTDHDILSGNKEFIKACKKQKINGISGVEIDCVGIFKERESGNLIEYKSEVLGYFPMQSYKNTKILLEPVINQRNRKIKHFLSRAREVFNNSSINWEDFKLFDSRLSKYKSSKKNLTFTIMKPLLFSYLKAKNITKLKNLDYKKFTNIYFGTDNSFNLGSNIPQSLLTKLDLKKVVSTINRDDGFAVIPHIAQRFLSKDARNIPSILFTELKEKAHIYRSFLHYCKKLNIWGIEMYYYNNWKNQPYIIKSLNDYIKNLAEDNFHFTWGSDCHGVDSMSDTLDKFYGYFNGFT